MGNGNSLPDVQGFSKEEVSRLEKRFHKLDLDRSGSISRGEFLSVPELKENPLIQRMVDVMDSDLSGEVDFKGELVALGSPESCYDDVVIRLCSDCLPQNPLCMVMRTNSFAAG